MRDDYFEQSMELINRSRNEMMAMPIVGVCEAAPPCGTALGVGSMGSPLTIGSRAIRQAWAAREQLERCLGSRARKRRHSSKRKG